MHINQTLLPTHWVIHYNMSCHPLSLLCRCVLEWRKRLTLTNHSIAEEEEEEIHRKKEKKNEFEGRQWRGKGSEEAISSHGKLVSYEWETIQCVRFHTGHSWFLHLCLCLCSNRCFGSNSVWFHCKNLFFLQSQWQKTYGKLKKKKWFLIILWQAGYTSPTQSAIINDLGLSVSEVFWIMNENLRMSFVWANVSCHYC